MLDQIEGIHHVTSLASDAVDNNRFFTEVLGLRRVKKTVNFDKPSVYHLYYGDEIGSPSTVMTHFPDASLPHGIAGTGEVGHTAFSVPMGSLDFWFDRLTASGVGKVHRDQAFGADRVSFVTSDGERFVLIEVESDDRAPWSGSEVPTAMAIRGFHSACLWLADMEPTAELLKFMGFVEADREGNVSRFVMPKGNSANIIDISVHRDMDPAQQGAGSVHHIAFAVADEAAQLAVRDGLLAMGYKVTEVRDRDYFKAIYFREPGGVLFEVATNEPGFDVDEDRAHLGEALKLPHKHAHLRTQLEQDLTPIGN